MSSNHGIGEEAAGGLTTQSLLQSNMICKRVATGQQRLVLERMPPSRRRFSLAGRAFELETARKRSKPPKHERVHAFETRQAVGGSQQQRH